MRSPLCALRRDHRAAFPHSFIACSNRVESIFKPSCIIDSIMKNLVHTFSLFVFVSGAFAQDAPEPTARIEAGVVHLRVGETREWSTFPAQASGSRLERRFRSRSNPDVWTLSLRQQDVKAVWQVMLNDKSLGLLVRDENAMMTDFPIPPGALMDGENTLKISPKKNPKINPNKAPKNKAPKSAFLDDIRVGEIQIHPMDQQTLRSAATIDVNLVDERDRPMAGRITIVDERGILMPVGAKSDVGLAVREGVVYTSTGKASFGVAPGTYKIYAGRGFEYSVASTDVEIESGQQVKRALSLQREVDTAGWVACDTHMHTVTHSGHGDCTIEERMVTLAGEGVELAIATDHNKHVDYQPFVIAAGLGSEFTPVIGNELSSKTGHFCIFPIEKGSPIPDFHVHDWKELFENIYETSGVRVAILNHARDVHSGYRPFSPRHHLSLTGENLDGQPQSYNALEVVNSGAIKNDAKLLLNDWCGLMNRGLSPIPVGGSDSHDVSRFIVGQARTYIRCDDTDAGSINMNQCVDAFLAGRVVVSYGLFANLTVNGAPIDTSLVTPEQNDLELEVEVRGPQWTDVDSVELYVCGQPRFSEAVTTDVSQSAGRKFRHKWRIPRSELTHDIWVTAVATGKGVTTPYWPMAKPYDADSPVFQPRTFSCTGAIRIDADADGKFSSPVDYADRLIVQHGEDLAAITKSLQDHHISVSHQVASRLRAAGTDLEELQQHADGKVSHAISRYRKAWRDSTIARLEQTE